jgi:hypothetical protein
MLLKFLIVWMVEFTDKSVNIWRSIPSNVGDKEGDEIGWDVVKHWVLNVDLGHQLPLAEPQDVVRWYYLVECVVIVGTGILWREFEESSTHQHRDRVSFGSQTEGIATVDRL